MLERYESCNFDINQNQIDFKLTFWIQIVASKLIILHPDLIKKFEIDPKRSEIDQNWLNPIKKDKLYYDFFDDFDFLIV